MVRDAARRKRKFEGRIHPERIGAKFAAQRETMTEQQGTYFSEISDVERKVKQVCEAAGVPGFEVAQYINVGRKCYSLAKKFSGATRDAEAQHVVDHWISRGLDPDLLQKACLAGGCDTKKAAAKCWNPCVHGPEKHGYNLPTWQAVGTTLDPTVTSTVFVDMPEMVLTVDTKGGPVLIIFDGSFIHQYGGWRIYIIINIDGSDRAESEMGQPPTGDNNQFHLTTHWLETLAAGSHEIKIRWRVDGYTGSAIGTRRVLSVVELRV